jgi:preprotein translocase subunit SecD
MLHTPLWKRLAIWLIVALGIAAAVPNLFYTRVEGHNDALKAAELSGFATPEQQAAIDAWPAVLPSALVNLGLDLRGGAHLLAEVQVADVYKARIDGLWPEVRDALRDLREQVGNVRRQPSPDGVLRVTISNPEGMAAAVEAVRALATPVVTMTGMGQSDIEVTAEGGDTIVVQLSEAEKIATDQRTIAQSLEIIRRRVDEVGTREPTIMRQGTDRILIQVPGIGSAAELKALIGTTARLTFHPVVGVTADPGADAGPRNLLLPSIDEEGRYYIVEETPVVSGEDLVDAQPAFDQNNRPAVNFRFNPAGARLFGDYTAANIGAPFAIVLDNEVISAPVIQAHIAGGSGIITGSFTVEESTELAVLLRAGALPAEMIFLEERTVGPELGQDSIDAGRVAAAVAMVAVAAFMWASYGLFGFLANVALLVNMALLFGALSLVGGTLTLPGIAGIVLTIGMAVDANVLVFERIREELRNQKSPARAIEIGYERALSAIIDANITTFITAVVLFAVGAGPVRGFAITLGLGIITSVFTALYVTRALVEIWFNWRRPKTVTV